MADSTALTLQKSPHGDDELVVANADGLAPEPQLGAAAEAAPVSDHDAHTAETADVAADAHHAEVHHSDAHVLDLTIDDTMEEPAPAKPEPLDLTQLKQAMMQLTRVMPEVTHDTDDHAAPERIIDEMPALASTHEPEHEAAQESFHPLSADDARQHEDIFEPATESVHEAVAEAAPQPFAEASPVTPAIPMPELLPAIAASAALAAQPAPVQSAPEPEPTVAEAPLPPGRIGVLLVNLGTPEAPDAPAVRRYLREFLSDRRVIENDGLLWKFVFNWIVLPLRPRIKARAYRKIWNMERNESPLKTITRSQAEKLGATIASVDDGIVVDWAMRYGNPSIPARMEALIKRGCERILLMPLYPQYSASTTATVCDVAFRELMQMRKQPALRVLPPYYDDTVYIEALASSIEAHLTAVGVTPEVIVASFHGMPREYIAKGDPYEQHCIETTRLLRNRLGLDDDKLIMTFQSRFGRGKWLEPATDKTIKKLAKSGVKSIAVITPGFSADCLETLEEIAIENAHIFKKAGGEHFTVIPCLNDSEPGMTVLWQSALRELKGWV